MCHYNTLHIASIHLVVEAFEKDPRLANDPTTSNRYDAACSAALAAAGQGSDAADQDANARVRLRPQALDWLRDELTARTKQLDGGQANDRARSMETAVLEAGRLPEQRSRCGSAGQALRRGAPGLATLLGRRRCPARESRSTVSVSTDGLDRKGWSADQGQEDFHRIMPSDRVFCVALSPEGKYLIKDISDQTLKRWDAGKVF
jgi:hypothetical protein